MSSASSEEESGTLPPPHTRRSTPTVNKTSNGRPSPYVRRTPRIRGMGLHLNDTKSNNVSRSRNGVDTIPDFGVSSVSWKTYRLTALYQFCYNKEKFKNYSQYLSSYIERERKKNVGVLLKETAGYTVKFSIIPGIRSSQADDETVKIEVFSKDDESNKISPQFTAILASVERSIEPWEHTLKNKKHFTVLPLLLVKGKQMFLKSLVHFLEDQFGCVVQPLTFSQVHLMWMVAMWTGSQGDSSAHRPLYLEYSTSSKLLKTIQYSIDGKTAYRVWKKIHDPMSNEMSEDEVYEFVNHLEDHFLKLNGINLAALHLSIVGTNAASVSRNGIIKIMNNSAVLYVLRHLTSLAQELIIS